MAGRVEEFKFRFRNPYSSIYPEKTANAFFSHRYFMSPAADFNFPEKEDEVIASLKNDPNLLEITKGDFCFIGGQFYDSPRQDNFFNKDKSKCVTVAQMNPINVDEYAPIAVKNLYRIILEQELSLGDRKIIKDIALDAYFHVLNLIKEGYTSKYSLNQCLCTDLNERAQHNLMDYGFHIKIPNAYVCMKL